MSRRMIISHYENNHGGAVKWLIGEKAIPPYSSLPSRRCRSRRFRRPRRCARPTPHARPRRGRHDHAPRRAAGDANVRDQAADQLALVGHQHDLAAVARSNGIELYRKAGPVVERGSRLTSQIPSAVSAVMGKRSPHEATCPRIASGFPRRTQHARHQLHSFR